MVVTTDDLKDILFGKGGRADRPMRAQARGRHVVRSRHARPPIPQAA